MSKVDDALLDARDRIVALADLVRSLQGQPNQPPPSDLTAQETSVDQLLQALDQTDTLVSQSQPGQPSPATAPTPTGTSIAETPSIPFNSPIPPAAAGSPAPATPPPTGSAPSPAVPAAAPPAAPPQSGPNAPSMPGPTAPVPPPG